MSRFLACLMLLVLLPWGAAGSWAQGAVPVEKSPEAPALQKQIEALLGAWAQEDVAGLEKVWSPTAEQRPRFLQLQQAFFQGAEIQKVEGLRFRGQVAEGRALLRINTTRTWRDPISWSVFTEPMVWEVYWEKEAGGWKVVEWEDCVVRLGMAFARGGTPEARAEAWKKDAEAATGALVRQFQAAAESFSQRGDWDGASRANQLQGEAARLSGDPQLAAEALSTRGAILYARAEYGAALEAWREAEQAYRAAGDPVGAAQMQLNRAVALEGRGDYRAALEAAEAGLAALAAAPAERRLEARVNRGTLLFRLSRYREAEADFQEAIRLAQQLQWVWGGAKAVMNLASVREAMGDYAAAQEMNEAALEVAREMGRRSEEIRVLNNLAVALQGRGSVSRALARAEEGLKLANEAGDAAGQAMLLATRSTVLQETGRFGEALTSLDEALALFRKQKARASEGIALQNLGALYDRAGRDEEARRAHEEAVRIARELGDRRSEVAGQVGLALYWIKKGDGTRAAEQMVAAHESARALGDPNVEVVVLLNWCHMLRQVRQYPGALKAGGEALQVARAMGDPRRVAGARLALGLTRSAAGKPEEAQADLREAVKLASQTGDRTLEMQAHWSLGGALVKLKRWKEAIPEYLQGASLLETVRTDVREQSLQTSFFAEHTFRYHNLAQALVETGAAGEALAAAERAKGRSLVDLLRRGKAPLSQKLPEPERKEETRLEIQLTTLSAELERAQELTTDQKLSLQQSLEKARLDYEAFRRRLALRHQEVQVQRGEFTPPSLKELGARLFAGSPGLTVLSYLSGEDQTLLFVVTAGLKPGAPAVVTPLRLALSARALREQSEQLRAACSQPGGDYRAASRKLYDALIAPAAKLLAGKTHLVVLPDSAMPPLPFQALLDPQGKHLVERWSLSYAPSVTALLAMRELRDRRKKEAVAAVPLVAVGRPKFASLADLPATEKEVQDIARQAGKGAALLVGGEATEARVRDALGKARYAHLATHGVLNEAAPLYSGLALTPAPGSDGMLEARELMELDLKSELVVLSACETGLGQQVRGEGVLGLTWALFVAGAPASVVTQWQVEDTSTGMLMQGFYGGLLRPAKGVPAPTKAQALRSAQLQLLKSKAQAHPYYWAPFVLAGDWR